MFSFIQGPLFRTKLTHERVYNFKHIHAVEAGMESFITLIVSSRMKHGIIYQHLIVSMKHFSYHEEILFFRIYKLTESSYKIMIQAVCYI